MSETSSLPLPLPSECCFKDCHNRSIISGYQLLLDALEVAQKNQNTEAIMNIKVIGFLLISLFESRETLGDGPAARVFTEVASSNANDSINELGIHYREKLLRACIVFNSQGLSLDDVPNVLTFVVRQPKGQLPTPSEHPSRPSFSTLEDMMKDCLEGSGLSYGGLKRRALARDGYRCMLSGALDLQYGKKNKNLTGDMRHTNCCHILPQSTVQNVDPNNPTHDKKRTYAASVLSVLRAFGLEKIIDKFLTADGIHDLGNVLTLTTDIHAVFDTLDMWLEGTGMPHEYRICSFDKRITKSLPEKVQFWNHAEKMDPTLSLPDPALLCIHAVCAKALHMSGAAEYIDELDEEFEGIGVLAQDGSSAKVLHDAVYRIAILQCPPKAFHTFNTLTDYSNTPLSWIVIG